MFALDLNQPAHLYFIGIGGISMSGLAELLHSKGFPVSGSDRSSSVITDRLASIGIPVAIGQRAENIGDDIDVAVYTAAVHPDNPEYAACVEKGIPLMDRAELLGQISKTFPLSIGVSGTHGKTTTTSMIAMILLQAGLDPTVSLGGMLAAIGGNLRIGSSKRFLFEACEYTNSFLKFFPTDICILNIDEDHLDFFKDLDDIRHSFRLFAERLPEGGVEGIVALLLGKSAAHGVPFAENRDAAGCLCQPAFDGLSEAHQLKAAGCVGDIVIVLGDEQLPVFRIQIIMLNEVKCQAVVDLCMTAQMLFFPYFNLPEYFFFF